MGMRALAVILSTCFMHCTEERAPVACAAYAAAGLSVTVENAATGQPICDAVMAASEGTYSESLFEVACTFSGAYERPGTYVVRVSRGGFRPSETGSVRVVMGDGECPHVEQARVTVRLTPG